MFGLTVKEDSVYSSETTMKEYVKVESFIEDPLLRYDYSISLFVERYEKTRYNIQDFLGDVGGYLEIISTVVMIMVGPF